MITKAKFDEKLKEVANLSTKFKKSGKGSSGFFTGDLKQNMVRTEPPSPEARDHQIESKRESKNLGPKPKPSYVELLKMNQKLLNAAVRDQNRTKKAKSKKPRKASLLYKS